MDTTQRLTEVAIDAARGAGEIAMGGFRSSDVRIDLKADIHDLVTQYDTACEAHIRAKIEAEVPDSVIVGEEVGETGAGAVTWYVDPIDGTAQFARGIAAWCVSIAAAIDGRVVSAAIYDPVHEHLFWADDRGAFLNDSPLVSRGYQEPSQATVLANFLLPRDLVWKPELSLQHFAELVRTYSAVRIVGCGTMSICHVAAGWSDATFNFETSSWDVAAASFILKQAGGEYYTYRDGQLLPEQGDFLNPHYLATIPGARYDLLHRIMREQSSRPAQNA
jgi:myo-inositol-1(or 4)-monophosphatase